MPSISVNKNVLDVAAIFQHYMAFAGDARKTALACGVEVEQVENLAHVENWSAKIADLNALKESNPTGFQIHINRAVNYVQAHRARDLLDRVIQFLSQGTPEELIDRLTVMTRNGPEFKTRALTDLVKAMESCQRMTCLALGDRTAEADGEGEAKKGSNVALLVMEAMNAAGEHGLNSVEVVKKQLAAPDKAVPQKVAE